MEAGRTSKAIAKVTKAGMVARALPQKLKLCYLDKYLSCKGRCGGALRCLALKGLEGPDLLR